MFYKCLSLIICKYLITYKTKIVLLLKSYKICWVIIKPQRFSVCVYNTKSIGYHSY